MKKSILLIVALLLVGCNLSSEPTYSYQNEQEEYCDNYCEDYEEEVLFYDYHEEYRENRCFFDEDGSNKYYLQDHCLSDLNIPYSLFDEVSYKDNGDAIILCDDTFYDFNFHCASVFFENKDVRLEYSNDTLSSDELYYCSFNEQNCSKEELMVITALVDKWKMYFPYEIQDYLSIEITLE